MTNRSFILTTSGLELGDHEIAVNGMDEAGNELDDNHEITFTVKASPATKIDLKPGMNLISFPGSPADTAINSVVTLSQVSAISTYDAASGTWLSATRDDSGSLSGDLTDIDAQHAYWVSTTSFDPIAVDIPSQGFANVPPAIQLVEGWNLVPVVVVGDQLSRPLPPIPTSAARAGSRLTPSTRRKASGRKSCPATSMTWKWAKATGCT